MKVYIPQKQTSLCCFLVFFSCPATREILQIPAEKESLPLDAVCAIKSCLKNLGNQLKKPLFLRRHGKRKIKLFLPSFHNSGSLSCLTHVFSCIICDRGEELAMACQEAKDARDRKD